MASISKHTDGRPRVRWQTPDGRHRSRIFPTMREARGFKTRLEHSLQVGEYVDRRHGKITFRTYAEEWAARQVWRDNTATDVNVALARTWDHIGDTPIGAIRPSHLQAMLRGMSKELAASTVGGTWAKVRAVFSAAVTDRVIASSPAAGVKAPKAVRGKVVPLEPAEVRALAAAMPDELAAAVLFAAGSGLRLGEVFGLTVDRVDWLRRSVRVDRQMLSPAGRAPEFGPPKTEASHRTVPLAKSTVDMLSAHLAEHPAVDGLVFHQAGKPWTRAKIGDRVRIARVKAGVPSATFHDLRHHYASVLIAAGCSVKAVQSALGHASAAETLDTYSHLWPADEDKIRAAIEAVSTVKGERATG